MKKLKNNTDIDINTENFNNFFKNKQILFSQFEFDIEFLGSSWSRINRGPPLTTNIINMIYSEVFEAAYLGYYCHKFETRFSNG